MIEQVGLLKPGQVDLLDLPLMCTASLLSIYIILDWECTSLGEGCFDAHSVYYKFNGQNSEGMCQGGKPGTGKLYTDVCLCCPAHTSGCVVDGLGATAAF